MRVHIASDETEHSSEPNLRRIRHHESVAILNVMHNVCTTMLRIKVPTKSSVVSQSFNLDSTERIDRTVCYGKPVENLLDYGHREKKGTLRNEDIGYDCTLVRQFNKIEGNVSRLVEIISCISQTLL